MTTTTLPTPRPLRKRMIVMLICLALLFGALVGFNFLKGYMIAKFVGEMSAQPVTVSTARASYQTWQPQIHAVGSIRAAQGVDVTTEVAGLIRQVRFKSGDEVKAGQVLLELNDADDIALLQSHKAAAELAKTAYDRDRTQYEIKAIPKATLDASAADLKSKQALARQQQALVDKKTIRAAFAGKLGIRTVNPGQYLKPGDAIVTLQALDPLFVDFSVPQEQLGQLSPGQTVNVETNARAGQWFGGKVTSISPKVDDATRSVRVEAQLANHQQKLLPGMYANIRIDAGARQRHLTLSQAALSYNAYGATAFIVKPGTKAGEDGKTLPVAEQVFVTTGPTRGDQVAILKGIQAGDQVVTSGQLKLKNGTALVVDNQVQPASEANPAPQEQ
ncbi:Multidrug RND efflux system membrane-fusion protein AcrA [Chromobacterium vaccinii]|nr:Multidrug RND efflux system membrane-fusion protein AcrA [Chromobacterium vaccinii]QND90355.1 Multidrug RND efflux system membrane-fusion protein AcrA [Chromobacterium vaccinii]